MLSQSQLLETDARLVRHLVRQMESCRFLKRPGRAWETVIVALKSIGQEKRRRNNRSHRIRNEKFRSKRKAVLIYKGQVEWCGYTVKWVGTNAQRQKT